MEIKMNQYQTLLTDELRDSLPKEVWGDILEYIATIKFIQNLIAPENIRGFIKDRPYMTFINELGEVERFKDGRRQIDLTNPHILEDMDYFRSQAIFYEANGRYTNIIPNSNPKSEFAQFWKDELYKWKHGVVRPDGEWIPGELYFYWNYNPIWLVEKAEGTTSDKRGERKREFPKPWLGDYLFFHYVNAGKEKGQHGKLLKTRGVGFSFKAAAWSPRNMYVHTGSGNPNFHLASEKGFLSGDKGIWGKILDTLDWIGDNTPLARMRIVDGKRAMEVQLGYEDEYGTRRGLLSSVFGISLKDNPDKARGIRGPLIHYEEDGLFPNLEKAWNVNRKAVEDGGITFGYMLAGGCLTENNKVWTNDGRLISINDIKQEDGIIGYNGLGSSKENIGWIKSPEKKECIRLTTSGGEFIECSIDHPILYTKNHWRKSKTINQKKVHLGKFCEFKRADEFVIGDQLLSIDNLNIFGNKHIEHARLLGLAIGDGCYKSGQSIRLACGDDEIYNYITNKYNCNTNYKKLQKDGSDYYNISLRGVQSIFRDAGIYGDVNENKKLPINIHDYNKESLAKLIGGYYDADGSINYNKKRNRVRITLTSKYIHLLEDVRNQLYRFGIHGKISKEYRKGGFKPGTIYRLYITSYNDLIKFKENIPLLINKKSKTLDKINEMSKKDSTRFPEGHHGYFKYNPDFKKGEYFRHIEHLDNLKQSSITNIEYIGEQTIYNLNATMTNTYLAGNIIVANTGGVEGASFAGSEKLFYSPGAYNIYGIPNVFDKNTNGETLCGFFWGAYMNRNKCYNESTGEPDIIKALIEICSDRYIVKYSSSDSGAITQKKAEEPITPQEAVMRTEGTVFPVSDLKEYLENISVKRETFLSEHYVGELVYASDGDLIWRPVGDRYPLRSYDMGAGDKTGCLEIFEMPKKGGDGRIIRGRYIAGIDPIDADVGASMFSILVMDTFTDRIVAEYTGRPRTANEAYDIALRTLKFYNAEANYESNLKGLFSYFDRHNALHYLADVPQILKDMDLVKQTNLFGNRSKGTHANAKINSWGRILQADWMKVKAHGDDEDHRLNLHRLRSLAYIEECIKWNSDGNFDRVSAGIMLFILREDRVKRTLSAKNQDGKPVKSLSADPFFSRNFQSNISQDDVFKINK